MIVNVKLNNLVWLLTGRSNGFVYPMLNTYISVPYASDKRVTAARKLLKLDVVGTDFFTYGALTAVYSSIYYVRDLDVEHQAAFIPGIVPFTVRSADVYERSDGEVVYAGNVPQPVTSSNAWTFLPFFDGSSVSVCQNIIDWDAPHDALRFERDGNSVIVTKFWLGDEGESRVFTAPTVVGNVVRLDAYEFAGVRACFDCTAGPVSWLNTQPKLYPYKKIRDLIADDAEMIALMRDMGTVGAFYETSSDMAAVGCLAVAIIRQTKTATSGPSYDVTLDYSNQVYTDMIGTPYTSPDGFAYGPPNYVFTDGVADTMRMVIKFDATTPEVTCYE